MIAFGSAFGSFSTTRRLRVLLTVHGQRHAVAAGRHNAAKPTATSAATTATDPPPPPPPPLRFHCVRWNPASAGVVAKSAHTVPFTSVILSDDRLRGLGQHVIDVRAERGLVP